MPELPEVETTRSGLRQVMTGQCIEAVELLRPDLRFPITRGLEETVQGSCVNAIRRLGKYLLIDLDNGWSLISHLGMSGSFRVSAERPEPLRKHDHVLIYLKDGPVVIYHDPRRFGLLMVTQTDQLAGHKLLKDMGPDPLDAKHFTTAYLWNALQRFSTPVKVALMDQKLVPGMGNIYASEALFRAGIDPRKPAKSLSKVRVARLVAAIPEVLHEAIASGGSTIRDFAHGEGLSGYFQHRFNVYGRTGKPCLRCKTPIIKIVQGGRATFWCRKCQR